MSTPAFSLTHPLQPLAQEQRRLPAMPTTVSVPRHISSQLLLEGARELVIRHQGGEYHLRLTRNDKLILTK
ncbi:MAG TPA: hemin uptake protein HemP [Rhodanobacter sp.]